MKSDSPVDTELANYQPITELLSSMVWSAESALNYSFKTFTLIPFNISLVWWQGGSGPYFQNLTPHFLLLWFIDPWRPKLKWGLALTSVILLTQQAFPLTKSVFGRMRVPVNLWNIYLERSDVILHGCLLSFTLISLGFDRYHLSRLKIINNNQLARKVFLLLHLFYLLLGAWQRTSEKLEGNTNAVTSCILTITALHKPQIAKMTILCVS